MNEKYYNLVFVKHESSDKNYLFKLPLNIELNIGKMVFVNTYQGQTLGTCSSNNFIVDKMTANAIMDGTGAYYPLKEVIGYAEKQEGYKCVDFAFVDVPF